ncbi:hypothetical protein ACS0TY_011779 [Phlomoides rotata]
MIESLEAPHRHLPSLLFVQRDFRRVSVCVESHDRRFDGRRCRARDHVTRVPVRVCLPDDCLQLGSVISVLEESYGIKAMIKSVGLIRGSWGISIVVFLVPILFYATLISVSMVYCVIFRDSMGVIGVLGFGGLILVLSVKMILLGLVMQTVLYFACKTYLHESIDKSALWDRLKGYLVDYYVPLKAKDVQMEEYEHHVSENSI